MSGHAHHGLSCQHRWQLGPDGLPLLVSRACRHRYGSWRVVMSARLAQRLDIDSLRALCAIEDHGGVTRAAAFLGLSQSAVSHKVKRLETSLETELLSRRPGAALFTDAGQDLLIYAKRILDIHDEALLSLSKTPLQGKISLGMTEDMTCGDLSRILGRFTRLHPAVSVRMQVHMSLTL